MAVDGSEIRKVVLRLRVVSQEESESSEFH